MADVVVRRHSLGRRQTMAPRKPDVGKMSDTSWKAAVASRNRESALGIDALRREASRLVLVSGHWSSAQLAVPPRTGGLNQER